MDGVARVDIVGLDTNGRSFKGGHCRTGQRRTGLAGVDIAGLNISGRACESELGNMLRFFYGRPVKTQPTGTRVKKSVELTYTERNYLNAYLK